jgi:outer membrane receptor for ferrienterochelin and colicin
MICELRLYQIYQTFFLYNSLDMRKASLCVVLLVLTAGTLKPQSEAVSLFDMSLEELMTLKISAGSNVVSEYKNQPISITSISKEQLELSGTRTLIEAIMVYVPGFFVVEDQDDVIAGTRGLAPDNNSKVMLLVDGQNLNTEFFWGPPSALLNSTSFEFVERIEVVRGPGSVILGQGALLSVINIITKAGSENRNNQSAFGSGTAKMGADGAFGVNALLNLNQNDVKAFLSLGIDRYHGQEIRREGWAKDKDNEGYRGGKILDIGTRLKKTSNNDFFASVTYKNLTLSALHFDQTKDLYNFYRDRNVFRQSLSSLSLSYKKELSSKISVKLSADAANDDFGLYSVENFTMGGTREQRAGTKLLLNFNELFSKNFLAVGSEFRYFRMGLSNREGNNFINNVITPGMLTEYDSYFDQSNANKTFGYASDLNVISLFVEDYQKIGSSVNVFGALRFDMHSYWGARVSPRLGTMVSPMNKLRLKLAYQEGFRGAVGLHYSGGYRQDGFLRAENLSQIESANIIHHENGTPVSTYTNIPETKPETMKSLEFTVDYDINPQLNLNTVFFYNNIENVIDVGVIWEDPAIYAVPAIGSDVPGDWNGYWYFKNTEGAIKQGGFEATATYKNSQLLINVSHSYVRVLSAAEQQKGSMYLTDEKHFKAYPENVTRLNCVASVSENLKIGGNYLFYQSWYSPKDQKVNGNHLVNLTAKYSMQQVSLSLAITNLLGQNNLYPMNSNASGPDLSDGTPAIEKTTAWARIEIRF